MICQGLEDCVFDTNTVIETNKIDLDPVEKILKYIYLFIFEIMNYKANYSKYKQAGGNQGHSSRPCSMYCKHASQVPTCS